MEKREAKVEDFINRHHRGMSVKENSLKFIQHSKYAFYLVSNNRDEIIRYVMDLSEELEEECGTIMLHENMDLSRLMVHEKQVEESLRKSSMEEE